MFRKFIENTFNIVKDAVLRIDLDYSDNSDTDIEEVLQVVTEEVQVRLQRMDEQPERRVESQGVLVHLSPDNEKCVVESEIVEKYPQGDEGREDPNVSRSIRDFDEFKISGEIACSLPANRATSSRGENKSCQQPEQNISSVPEESNVRPNQLPQELSHSIDPIQTDPGCARHIAGNLMDDVQCDPGCDNPIPRHHLAAAEEQNEDEGIHLNEEYDHQDLHYRHQTADETERFRTLKHDKQDDKNDTVLVIEISTGGKGLLADEPVQQNYVEANENIQPPVAEDDEANNLEQLADQLIVQLVDQQADQPIIQPDDQEVVGLLLQPIVQPAGQEAEQPVVQPAGQEAEQPVVQPADQEAEQPVVQPADQEANQPVVQLADQDLAQAGPPNPQDDNESLPTDDDDDGDDDDDDDDDHHRHRHHHHHRHRNNGFYDYLLFNGLDSSEIDDD